MNMRREISLNVTTKISRGLALLAIAGVGLAPQQVSAETTGGFADLAPGVTGGAGGATVTVTNGADLNQYTDAKEPLIIQIAGTLQINGMDTHVRPNKTIIGLGTNAVLEGGGLYLYRSQNVIIRNLTIKGSTDDNMGLLLSSNIWIDHCTFVDAKDGNLDIRRASDNITVSWCKFYYQSNQTHALSCLLGSNDRETDCEGKLHVTFHHNWWAEGCKERMPSVRWGTVHLYNNYYSCAGNNYCARIRLNAQARIENNVYEGVRNPWEVYITDPTNAVGRIFATNNLELNVKWGNSTTNTRKGLSIVQIVPGTNDVFVPTYAFTLDQPADVAARVQAEAGAGRGPFAP
jgi:pectate lyase